MVSSERATWGSKGRALSTTTASGLSGPLAAR